MLMFHIFWLSLSPCIIVYYFYANIKLLNSLLYYFYANIKLFNSLLYYFYANIDLFHAEVWLYCLTSMRIHVGRVFTEGRGVINNLSLLTKDLVSVQLLLVSFSSRDCIIYEVRYRASVGRAHFDSTFAVCRLWCSG